MVGETAFGQQRTAGRQQRALYGNRLELPTPGEGVVEVVDDGCHCDAVDRGHRAALREGCATAETPRTAERTHATRDATELQKLPSVHCSSLSLASVAPRLGVPHQVDQLAFQLHMLIAMRSASVVAGDTVGRVGWPPIEHKYIERRIAIICSYG